MGSQREIKQHHILSIFYIHTQIYLFLVTIVIFAFESLSPGQSRGSRDSEKDFLSTIFVTPFHSELLLLSFSCKESYIVCLGYAIKQ